MSDESRIDALEHELKILKNEIQTTLLEIREQILNHYYPELRADEPLHSLSLPVRRAANRAGSSQSASRTASSPTLAEIQAKGQIEPFTDIFLEDLADDLVNDPNAVHELVNSRRPPITAIQPEISDLDDDEEFDEESNVAQGINTGGANGVHGSNGKGTVSKRSGEAPGINTVKGTQPQTNVAPQTREVDFRQMKAASAAKREPRAKKGQPLASQTNQLSPAANPLIAWANEAVHKVGKVRAAKVVETYAMGDQLSNDTKDSLLRLIALAEENEPDGKISSREMLELMVELDQVIG